MKFNLDIDNINYIKIVYKDKNNFSHCAKAAVRRIDAKEIYASAKFEENIFANTPQEVELSVACEDGLYSSKTVLKYIENADPYVFFTLKTPEEADYKQEREFFRVKLADDATVYYFEDDKSIKVNTKIYDISANGVRLRLDTPIQFPEEVQIVLHFPKRDVRALAKYVRSDDEDKIHKSSFTFVNLSASEGDYISQICIQRQIAIRKNKLL